MPQRKNRVIGSVSSSSSRQPELKDPGGLRGEETGEDREMELGWKSTARRVISRANWRVLLDRSAI